MIKDNRIAYCGLFCGSCDIFIASKNCDLDKIAREKDIDKIFLYCEGCKSAKVSIFCRNCMIKKCNKYKKLSNCSECNEFPCSVLIAFQEDGVSHHKDVIRNLILLKKNGAQQFISSKQKEHSCPKCGTVFSWNDKICPVCKFSVGQ